MYPVFADFVEPVEDLGDVTLQAKLSCPDEYLQMLLSHPGALRSSMSGNAPLAGKKVPYFHGCRCIEPAGFIYTWMQIFPLTFESAGDGMAWRQLSLKYLKVNLDKLSRRRGWKCGLEKHVNKYLVYCAGREDEAFWGDGSELRKG